MAVIAPERPEAPAPVPPPQKRRTRLRSPRFAMAIPAWVWLLLFFLIPVSFIFYYSLGRKPGLFELRPGQSNTISTDHLSLDRYGEVLDPNGPLWGILQNTYQIAIVGTLACLLIAFPFAYWMAVKLPERYRGVMLALILLPFWTNFLIRTVAWQILLFPDGWFSGLLQDLGLRDAPLALLDTRSAVQIGVVYNYLVLMILPLFVVMDRIDPALRDASKDLGAGRLKTFWQVTLPLSMPGVISGLLLVFIPLMGDYITPSVLGGAKGAMVGNQVYSQFLEAQNWAKGSALAIVLIGIILLTVMVGGLILWFASWLVKRSWRVDLSDVRAS